MVRRRLGRPVRVGALRRGVDVPERAGRRRGPGAPVAGEEIAEAQAREVAEQSGLPDAEAVGEEGDPATAVLRAADELHVDVIVVGTEERGWLDRLLRPSVSKEIVRHAHVPVLLVH